MWVGERPSIPSRCFDRRIEPMVIKAGLIAARVGAGKRCHALSTIFVLGDAAALVYAAGIPDPCGNGYRRQGAELKAAGYARPHRAGLALPVKPVLHHRRGDVSIGVWRRLDQGLAAVLALQGDAKALRQAQASLDGAALAGESGAAFAGDFRGGGGKGE